VKKRINFFAFGILFAFIFSSCNYSDRDSYESTDYIMGTVVIQRIYHKEAEKIGEKVKKRIAEMENINEKKLEDYIKKVDKKRSNHYKYYTNKKWGDVTNYDLCINSSSLGIDKTVELILDYVKMKNKAK